MDRKDDLVDSSEVLDQSVYVICHFNREDGSVIWKGDRDQKTVLEQARNN